MSNTASAPTQAGLHGRLPGRGGPPGRLIVGDYVGQPAAEAAQGVRRAGLRPGLDRSFGCDANLTGLIVAQEPSGGEELGRNGMVTLYVAAPGNTVVEEIVERSDGTGDGEVPRSAVNAQACAPQSKAEPHQVEGARRLRKPGLAKGETTHLFDPVPDPRVTLQYACGLEEPSLGETPIAGECDASPDACAQTFKFGRVARLQASEGELSHEEFVVHTDDVFAGRAGGGPGWRRPYPRRQAGRTVRRVLARATGHPVLSMTTCAMFAVWIAVAVAGGVARRAAHTPVSSMLPQNHARTGSARTAVRRATVSRAKRTAPPAITSGTRAQTPHRIAPGRVPGKPRAVKASPVPESAQAVSSAAGSAPVHTTPALTREQTDGGPFSP